MNNNRYLQYCLEVNRFRYVLYQLVKQHLVLRYRRTFMGYLWTLINPLLMMSVTAIVFSTVFKMDLKTFAVFLFAGMIPFNYFSTAVSQCAISITGNEGLIKKIYIPKLIFTLSTSLGLFIDCILTSATLLILIFVIGGKLSWPLFFLPFSFLLLFMFSLGLSMIVAVVTVYFRDLQHVLGIVLQALFFLTPILYKPEALAGKIAFLVALNPVVPFIDLFRAPIYLGTLPSNGTLLLSLTYTFISMVGGFLFFMKYERKLVFRL